MKRSRILTLEECAEELRASVKTIRRRINCGELRAFKEGGRVLVLESELEAFLERKTGGVATR